jgi:segregation and condensation protein B
MNDSYVRNVIEAALLAAGGPLPVAELTRLFDDSVRPGAQAVRAALASLEAEYAGRGIELKETASGFRIQVRRELATEISRLWPERAARYSRALLETLALIAYRQPITRAEIEAVRGVAVNPNIIRTMIERNWVRVVGHRDVAGRPELLGTTREFLDYFGLKNLDELPPLAELKAMGDINLQLALAGEVATADAAAGGSEVAEGAAADVGIQSTGEAPGSSEDAGSAPDEGSEDDELSADGRGSAELVAAPSDPDR